MGVLLPTLAALGLLGYLCVANRRKRRWEAENGPLPSTPPSPDVKEMVDAEQRRRYQAPAPQEEQQFDPPLLREAIAVTPPIQRVQLRNERMSQPHLIPVTPPVQLSQLHQDLQLLSPDRDQEGLETHLPPPTPTFLTALRPPPGRNGSTARSLAEMDATPSAVEMFSGESTPPRLELSADEAAMAMANGTFYESSDGEDDQEDRTPSPQEKDANDVVAPRGSNPDDYESRPLPAVPPPSSGSISSPAPGRSAVGFGSSRGQRGSNVSVTSRQSRESANSGRRNGVSSGGGSGRNRSSSAVSDMAGNHSVSASAGRNRGESVNTQVSVMTAPRESVGERSRGESVNTLVSIVSVPERERDRAGERIGERAVRDRETLKEGMKSRESKREVQREARRESEREMEMEEAEERLKAERGRGRDKNRKSMHELP